MCVSEKMNDELIVTTLHDVDDCDECIQIIIGENEGVLFEGIYYSSLDRELTLQTREPISLDAWENRNDGKVYKISSK